MRAVLGLVSMAVLAACNIGSPENGQRMSVEPGEGEAVGEVALADFDEVTLAGPDHVRITIGEEFSVRAEGPEEILELLEFERDGDTLEIKRDNQGFGINGPNGVATVYVTMPALEGVTLAGSGNMRIDRAESEEFDVTIAGSGSVAIGELSATDAEFRIAGSGDLDVAGTAARVEIDVAGSGNVVASDLEVERMDINIAGSGDVEAFVTGEVDADFIGSGNARIRGGAQCNSRSMGSGELTCE